MLHTEHQEIDVGGRTLSSDLRGGCGVVFRYKRLYIIIINGVLRLPRSISRLLLRPPSSSARASEGVYTDSSTHLLKGMTELWIVLDGVPVLCGETGEGGTKLLELGLEIGNLSLRYRGR